MILTNLAVGQTYQQVSWIAKFGMAVGFTPTWANPDLSSVNQKINALGLDELSDKGMILYGGGGYAYLMFMKNLRIGGWGYSGKLNTTGNINDVDKEVCYSTGGGAISLEYTIPGIKNVALSVGVLLGAGSTDVEIFSHSGGMSWGDIWTVQDISKRDYVRITNSFYNVSPIVNLDVPFNRFMAFRVGAGYQFTFTNDYEYDNGLELNEVPDSFNSDLFFIQTGIFVGFFAF